MNFVVWLTGPSGVGKTVLSRGLKEKLKELGYKVEIFDGDEVRRELYPDIGFSKEAREMHNRVVIHMATLLSRNGVVVIVSLISPYRAVRDYARKKVGNFIEVYLKCSMETRIKRDPKGLYAKAIKGEISGLTGYDAVYEEPENPELVLNSEEMSIEEEVEAIIKKAVELGYMNR